MTSKDPIALSATALMLPPVKGTQFHAVAHQGGGARFGKEVLYTGTFRHPSTGKIHEFSRSDLEHIAAQSNRIVADEGMSVPFPDGHSFDARRNMGFWRDFTVQPSDSKPGEFGLFANVDVPRAEDASKMGKTITEVSVFLEQEVKLTSGEDLEGPVCTHVCATNYPVIPGQGNFVATLSRGEVDVSLLTREDPAAGDENMDELLKILALSLGLPSDSTKEAIGLAAKTAFEERAALQKENATLLEGINMSTTGGATSAKETEREAALAKENMVLRQEKAQALVDSALEAGKITRAEADSFGKLIAVGKVQVVPLGATQAEEIDAFDLVKGLMEGRTPNSAMSTETRSTSGAPSELEREKTSAARSALYFENKGYKITWLDEDHLRFSVDKR